MCLELSIVSWVLSSPAFQNKIQVVHLGSKQSKTRRCEVAAGAGNPDPHVTHPGCTSTPPSDHS